jgi:hypothetical protein
MERVFAPTWVSQLRTTLAAISAPLSDRMCAGTPRISMTSAIVSSKPKLLMRRATRMARHSRYGYRCRFALPIDTSIWRSTVTICSALNLFFGMTSSFPSLFSHNAWFKKARSGQSPPSSLWNLVALAVLALHHGKVQS